MFTYSSRVFALIGNAQINSLLPPPLLSPVPTYSTIWTPSLPVDFATPPWVQVFVPFYCLIVTPQDGARDPTQLG